MNKYRIFYVLLFISLFMVSFSYATTSSSSIRFLFMNSINEASRIPTPIGVHVGEYQKLDVLIWNESIRQAKIQLRNQNATDHDYYEAKSKLLSAKQRFLFTAVPFPQKNKLNEQLIMAHALSVIPGDLVGEYPQKDIDQWNLILKKTEEVFNSKICNQSEVNIALEQLINQKQLLLTSVILKPEKKNLQSMVSSLESFSPNIGEHVGEYPEDLVFLFKQARAHAIDILQSKTANQSMVDNAQVGLSVTKSNLIPNPTPNKSDLFDFIQKLSLNPFSSDQHSLEYSILCIAKQLSNNVFSNQSEINDFLLDANQHLTHSLISLTNPTFIQISSGYDHVVGLDQHQQVWIFGQNNKGQLGNGTKIPYASWVKVKNLPEVQSVAAGVQSSYALTTQGDVYAWGDVLNHESLIPKKIDNLTEVTSMYVNPKKSTQIFATKKDGSVWVLGENLDGQLGTGIIKDEISPIKISITNLVDVSFGDHHILLKDKNNTVYAAGSNSHGQIGNGSIWGTSSFVSVFLEASQISASHDQSFVVHQNGSVYGWGDSSQGLIESHIDLDRPHRMNGLESIQSIIIGNDTAFAITTAHALFSWGNNEFGQLGINDFSIKTSENPLFIPNLLDVQNIWNINDSIFAKSNDGTMYTWGRNDRFQLGDYTTINQSSPTVWNSISSVEEMIQLSSDFYARTSNFHFLMWNSLIKIPTFTNSSLNYEDITQQSTLFVKKENSVIHQLYISLDRTHWNHIGFPFESSKTHRNYDEISFNHPNDDVWVAVVSNNETLSSVASFKISEAGNYTIEKQTLLNHKPMETIHIFYQSDTPMFIHYAEHGQNWTKPPGILMKDSSYQGYKEYTITTDEGFIEAVFANKDGLFANENQENSVISSGTWTLRGQKIYEMSPDQDLIQVYYRTDWNEQEYIMYRIITNNQPSEWVRSLMVNSTLDGYYEYEKIVPNDSMLECVFYNEKKEFNTNNGENYILSAGDHWINMDDLP